MKRLAPSVVLVFSLILTPGFARTAEASVSVQVGVGGAVVVGGAVLFWNVGLYGFSDNVPLKRSYGFASVPIDIISSDRSQSDFFSDATDPDRSFFRSPLSFGFPLFVYRW